MISPHLPRVSKTNTNSSIHELDLTNKPKFNMNIGIS